MRVFAGDFHRKKNPRQSESGGRERETVPHHRGLSCPVVSNGREELGCRVARIPFSPVIDAGSKYPSAPRRVIVHRPADWRIILRRKIGNIETTGFVYKYRDRGLRGNNRVIEHPERELSAKLGHTLCVPGSNPLDIEILVIDFIAAHCK